MVPNQSRGFKALQTRMVRLFLETATKTSVCTNATCPRKGRRGDLIKVFGVRVEHDPEGRPLRVMKQPRCKHCRSLKKGVEPTRVSAAADAAVDALKH